MTTLPIITFVAVLAVMLSIYWVLAVRPETASQSAIQKRLKSAARPAHKQRLLFVKGRQFSDVPALNAVLRSSRAFSGRLQATLDRSGLKYTVGTLVLACACCGALVYLLLSRATGTVLASALLAGFAAFSPYLFVRWKAGQRMQRFEELFPEAIGLIIRALRAGHGFATGLSMVADELAEPVGPEFRLVYDLQNFGMPLEDALTSLAERIPLLDVRFFVTAVLTQRDAGGNLAEVLENISSVIRDRFKVKRQVRVVTAHARITGGVLAGMPPVVALVMFIIAPAHMKSLVTDPIGVRMVIGAIVLQVVGALAIRKIVDIEY
ncbi:MAG: type II secretion system F family protein [Acidobacteria bacterium]|nr:type II secretion system F family protein [Acidobacteriota bacterium]